MAVEYSLFRVKFIRPVQATLLDLATDDRLTATDLMLRSINERPSDEPREGYLWHIGNVVPFSRATGSFAVGRTTSSTIARFDEETGNFTEEEFEESPFTLCVFDANIGFLGIASKAALSPTTRGIARRIENLLGQTTVVTERGVTVEIRPIPDPDGFIAALGAAYRVSRFSATFRGPNPVDADELFQKPLAVYLNAAKGDHGRTSIVGTDLDREVLQEVTRSTAATGNEASARVQRTKKQKAITIQLKGDPVKRKYDDADHQPERALTDLTNMYEKVRGDQAR